MKQVIVKDDQDQCGSNASNEHHPFLRFKWRYLLFFLFALHVYIVFANVVLRATVSLALLPCTLLIFLICFKQTFRRRWLTLVMVVGLNVLLVLLPMDIRFRFTGSWSIQRARIVYGLPDPAMRQMIERGELVWMGCLIGRGIPARTVYVITF